MPKSKKVRTVSIQFKIRNYSIAWTELYRVKENQALAELRRLNKMFPELCFYSPDFIHG